MRCLVVEDYSPLRKNLVEYLREDGYIVDECATGDDGLWAARDQHYDVIILDIMLPKVDGLEILAQIRAAQDKTPVLIISARDAIDQRIHGLDAGADDYLVKPFALNELAARVRSLIRRSYGQQEAVVEINDLRIDTSHKSVTRAGIEISLTRKEYQLLEYLAYRQGKPVTRTEIWEHVYDDLVGGNSNTVDVYIGYLRKKIHADHLPDLIHTRRGFGYTLSSTAP